MKFADLLKLPYDENTRIIDLGALRTNFPTIPEEILRQVMSDHGRNSEFQSAYSEIDLDKVRWNREKLDACRIISATMNPRFRKWFESVSTKAQDVGALGWKAADSRRTVCEQWAKNQTWIVPPVLFSGALVGSPEEFHLVEGHTRVGLLFGLVKHGVISPISSHIVWVGREASFRRTRINHAQPHSIHS